MSNKAGLFGHHFFVAIHSILMSISQKNGKINPKIGRILYRFNEITSFQKALPL